MGPHEKFGDHWEPKDGSGPSDERARNRRARHNEGETAGGVDVAGHAREELYERAKELGISGRSSMNRQELGRAIPARTIERAPPRRQVVT